MRITTRARSRALLGCTATALLVVAGCGSDADHGMDAGGHGAMSSMATDDTMPHSGGGSMHDTPMGPTPMGPTPMGSTPMATDGHHGHDDGHQHGGGPTEGAHGTNSAVPDGARTVRVAATSFAFDPDEIVVSAGEPIAVELTSDDIVHDFVIDQLDAHISAASGASSVGGFTAGAAGTYTFYCSVDGHRATGMEGTLIVQ